ncbi:hypothetical protein Pmar_PMAR022981 [Perkinsus marinus ATCC 50983]|uniref:Uncharacterized protein n=1 Tax=Perkinsus marinus (strain ATCC 50983 / TXsc) TaxID=423536 RepID=C5LHT0_PERM5|nr:hypothetical protein Pmar_PMAR022981 [Perkinsus marinus ATCC 50983]EER03684.1 hypothetical protein Pmar_PMAR022981 [Perkinsus marinus ATCC 50983]|eukprot:XP_002771868.1 hypothetical protein Pmar_PMAR022981 [Perkinsus marinus ATCC 50983]
MLKQLYEASIQHIKRHPAAPVEALATHHRNVALGFLQQFSTFGVEVCGCRAPSSRAHMRRAVWQRTECVNLPDFVKAETARDPKFLNYLAALAAMECPVVIPSKSLVKVAAQESAPRKIIYASKRLRRWIDLTEVHTCRQCSKKDRCSLFKVLPPEEEGDGEKATVGDVAKVLFGLAQVCRIHIQRPDVYPIYHLSGSTFEAASYVLERMSMYLRETSDMRDIPLADRKTAGELMKQLAKEKFQKKELEEEAKKYNMPQWMVAMLNPSSEHFPKKLSRKQKVIYNQMKAGEEGEADEWVEEERVEGMMKPTVVLEDDNVEQPSGAPTGHGSAETTRLSDGSLIQLDSLDDIPVTRRFEHKLRDEDHERIQFVNRQYMKYQKAAQLESDKRKENKVNLDDLPKQPMHERGVQSGGYVDVAPEDIERIGNGEAIREQRDLATLLCSYHDDQELGEGRRAEVLREMQRIVRVDPVASQGVVFYKNPTALSKPGEFLDLYPNFAKHLWSESDRFKEDKMLSFLKRVPLDAMSAAGRGQISGARQSPSKIPRENLLDKEDGVEVAAPDRRQLLSAEEEDVLVEAKLALESIGEEDAFDRGPGMRDAVLQMALEEKQEEMGRPAGGGRRADRRRAREEEEGRSRRGRDGEDFRFDQWTKLRSKESLKLVEPDIDIGTYRTSPLAAPNSSMPDPGATSAIEDAVHATEARPDWSPVLDTSSSQAKMEAAKAEMSGIRDEGDHIATKKLRFPKLASLNPHHEPYYSRDKPTETVQQKSRPSVAVSPLKLERSRLGNLDRLMKKDQPAAPSGDQKPRFKMTRRLDSTPGGDPVVQDLADPANLMDRLTTEEVNRSSAALERLMKKHRKQDAAIERSKSAAGPGLGGSVEPKERRRRPRFSPTELSGTWTVSRKR